LKAAVLETINAPLVIRDIEPAELRLGQVLVKVLTSGICGAQLQELDGRKGNSKFLPHLMGHEGCGVVQKVGAGVSSVKEGDKVVMHWRQGIGIDAEFPSYVIDGKSFYSGKVNTLTEYAIVSENRITRVPSDTSSELAALLGCSLSTALGYIENQSNLKFGESVLILGCGGVGLNLISAARMRGAGVIATLDLSPEKSTLAILQGANLFYYVRSEIKEKFDLIIDTTGDTDLLSWAFSQLSSRGRLVLVGQPIPGKELKLPNAINMFNGDGLLLTATQGGSTHPTKDIPRYIELFHQRKMSIESLITHRFPLESINEAFDCLKSGIAGRIMIQIVEER